VPLYMGELSPHLTQCRLGRAYLCTKWHLDPCSLFVTIDMGRGLRTEACVKVGAAVPLSLGQLVPINIMWLAGPWPTSLPSGS